MPERNDKGFSKHDLKRKAICTSLEKVVKDLPTERETVLTFTYIAAHAMRLAIELEARIAEGEQG